jgi:hypothetical protein
MRILLDEQLPRQLAREFPGHDVHTVQQRGWAGLGNGELLRREPPTASKFSLPPIKICSSSRTWSNPRFASSLWLPRATLWKISSHSSPRSSRRFGCRRNQAKFGESAPPNRWPSALRTLLHARHHLSRRHVRPSRRRGTTANRGTSNVLKVTAASRHSRRSANRGSRDPAVALHPRFHGGDDPPSKTDPVRASGYFCRAMILSLIWA